MGMKFDNKIAAILLELIADVTPEAHLIESYELPTEWRCKLEPGLFPKTTTPADVLGYLLVMSQSGLICPPPKPETLRNLLATLPANRLDDPNLPFANFCYDTLPKHLPQYFLTVQGYEFLEKHQPAPN
jgi:hypothetical protein